MPASPQIWFLSCDLRRPNVDRIHLLSELLQENLHCRYVLLKTSCDDHSNLTDRKAPRVFRQKKSAHLRWDLCSVDWCVGYRVQGLALPVDFSGAQAPTRRGRATRLSLGPRLPWENWCIPHTPYTFYLPPTKWSKSSVLHIYIYHF